MSAPLCLKPIAKLQGTEKNHRHSCQLITTSNAHLYLVLHSELLSKTIPEQPSVVACVEWNAVHLVTPSAQQTADFHHLLVD